MKAGASASYINSHLLTTPLHIAARESKIDKIKVLLKYKADVSQPDGDDLVPLQCLLIKLAECQYKEKIDYVRK